MNRITMNKFNDSPFHKMSFETAGRFLAESVTFGDFDHLKGPSTRLSMGMPVREGSGCVDIIAPIQ